jgi:hypothetical protein
MRAAIALIAALQLCSTVAARAQDIAAVVTLAPGEIATIQLDPKHQGGVTVMERGSAPAMSALAQQAARDLSPGGASADATGQNVVPIEGPSDGLEPLPANAVRLSFAQVPDQDQVVLMIENGYQHALAYRATIHVNGREQPSDVCLVLPALRSFEHWPYLIERIDLSDFEARNWRDGDPITCE